LILLRACVKRENFSRKKHQSVRAAFAKTACSELQQYVWIYVLRRAHWPERLLVINLYAYQPCVSFVQIYRTLVRRYRVRLRRYRVLCADTGLLCG
jgi:hypothetical protein